MRMYIALTTLILTFGNVGALAQDSDVPPSKLPSSMDDRGAPVSGTFDAILQFDGFPRLDDLPTARLSKTAGEPVSELTGWTRSAKGAQIYRAASPSVVLIMTKDGFGTGSLISNSGEVLTNWHVINGYRDVAVVFKPAVEGRAPDREHIKLGQVVRYDEVGDLALIKVGELPSGRKPIMLGDSSEISVGADVHAIGHPTGEAWTYTNGVISQYRLGYEWTSGREKLKHKADVIQTQTPINPGNSGGPLISDSGTLIGVNSFKAVGSEGLNFAISVDDVKRFVTRPGNRTSEAPPCKPKEFSKSRNKANDSTVIAYDLTCGGKVNSNYIIPDKKSDAIMLTWDRNGDNVPDVIFFDLKRRGKWDLSYWDDKFEGHWTLVGYHDDGSLKPSRFESFDTFKKRLAER
jgi:S1-C subfamily serine protease